MVLWKTKWCCGEADKKEEKKRQKTIETDGHLALRDEKSFDGGHEVLGQGADVDVALVDQLVVLPQVLRHRQVLHELPWWWWLWWLEDVVEW